jgi:hypothetical protein
MKYFELAATNVSAVTAAFRKIADDLLQVAWYVCSTSMNAPKLTSQSCTTDPPNNAQSRWCSVM